MLSGTREEEEEEEEEKRWLLAAGHEMSNRTLSCRCHA